MTNQEAIFEASKLIEAADHVLIGAGAGMGVDSGLPDFRGSAGFWNAYPPFQGRSLDELSNPFWFKSDPTEAWGYFGHRIDLYRNTVPHSGFDILLNIAKSKQSYFVYTSNVDGQFQKAGFDKDRIAECHGSIHRLQCSNNCSERCWSAECVDLDVDLETFRTGSPLPTCGACNAVARPNILMFDDLWWISEVTDQQEKCYQNWLKSVVGSRLVTLEIGAGTFIPTIRLECQSNTGDLIRINTKDFEAPPNGVSISLGAMNALEQIGSLLV